MSGRTELSISSEARTQITWTADDLYAVELGTEALDWDVDEFRAFDGQTVTTVTAWFRELPEDVEYGVEPLSIVRMNA